jgi:hypothetical protein
MIAIASDHLSHRVNSHGSQRDELSARFVTFDTLFGFQG